MRKIFFGVYTFYLALRWAACFLNPNVYEVLSLALRPNTSPLGAVLLSWETRAPDLHNKVEENKTPNTANEKDGKKSNTEARMC